MADETMTKKVTDLTESTEPTDEDLFLAGSAGTASLRKIKWSNIWTKITSSILNKLVANNLITTAAGFLLDARQGKVLDDKLTKLNTNILIHEITLSDTSRTEISNLSGQVIQQGKKIIIDCTFTTTQTIGGDIWIIGNSVGLPACSSKYIACRPTAPVHKRTSEDAAHYIGNVVLNAHGIVCSIRQAATYYFHMEYVTD